MHLNQISMKTILGLNGIPLQGHDPAAAIIVNNKVVAAVEEERLCRKKRGMGLSPDNAALEVVKLAGISPKDIDIVAIPWIPESMGYDRQHLDSNIRKWLLSLGFRGNDIEICFVEHHTAHAWSGLSYTSDLKGKKYSILVVDGSGESTGGAAFIFNNDLKCLWHIEQSSSLGIYYEAVSSYIGFNWGEEGKTMGLASYGRNLGLKMPQIPDERRVSIIGNWDMALGSPKHRHEKYRSQIVDSIYEIHGQPLHFNDKADISLAAQNIVSERIMKYVKELCVDVDGFVLAGGVALNCSINVSVAQYCKANNIDFVIPPPASDTGVALGAAIAANYIYNGNVAYTKSPYLGASYSIDDICSRLHKTNIQVIPVSTEEIVSMLFDYNYICGWFDGRSEIGPRALGHRCIIARPDSTYIRDKINVLKGRESWRPLAPSVTIQEFNKSYTDSIPSKYMLINAINQTYSKALAGVTHVDGTARPQVVTEEGAYLSLIKSVGKIAGGCEAIICTSFNMAGEPIVYSPEDAINSASKMGLDAVVGNGWMVKLKK